MTYKKLILAVLAAGAIATGAFASGSSDDDEEIRRGGRPGMSRDGEFDPEAMEAEREERMAEMMEDAETYEGTFTIVDGEYPAIVDADGNTWYLMIPGMMGGRPEMQGGRSESPRGDAMDEIAVPEEGAEVSVLAIAGGKSPNQLMVLEATVDGEELEFPAGPMMGGRGGGRPGKTG